MIQWTDLQRITLLHGLTKPELETLADLMERREVPRGACVVRASQPGQFLMFVLEGVFKVELTDPDGRAVTLDLLECGEMFGEISLLTGEPRSANVEALEDSTVLVLSQHNFEQYVLQHRGLTLALLRELAFRLRATTAKVGDLALLDVYRRVARVLFSLSVEQPDGQGNVVRVVAERPTHRELASLAGTTREMVTRALKELEDAGHIAMDGKHITIQSLPARLSRP